MGSNSSFPHSPQKDNATTAQPHSDCTGVPKAMAISNNLGFRYVCDSSCPDFCVKCNWVHPENNGVGLLSEDRFRSSTMNPNLELSGKEAYGSSQVDLSPFSTVVAFDPVLPLARVPVPAGQGDDPAKGPYVLAFRNEETWRQAWRTCKEKIVTQCEAGAKVGCSITAAKACGRPWWQPSLPFFGNSASDDQSKREECEEKEMRGCLVSSHERCSRYARETCDPIYANMRIAAPGAPIDRRFSGKPLRRPRVTRHDKLQVPTEQAESPESPDSAADEEEERPRLGVTTFRGRLLMQNERRDEWERMSMNWSSHAAHAPDSASLQQAFPKEGWVGGLVHPAPRKVPVQGEFKDDSAASKHLLFSAFEWWQKLQQSVMAKFSS